MTCTVSQPHGRLLFLNLASPVNLDEVQRVGSKLQALMPGLAAPGAVFVSDLTRATTVPEDVVEAFGSMMRHDNKLLFRGALLVGKNPIGSQIETAVKDAKFPTRRVFQSRRELEEWLNPVLTEAERRSLSDYLATKS